MTTIEFTHLGEPMAKGSVVARVAYRKDGMPIAIKHDSSGLPGQRDNASIARSALTARNEAGVGVFRDVAVEVALRFYTARNKGHFRTGAHAGLLRDSAPARPGKRPDVDKLSRHVLDALTGVVYADDGQVVTLVASKHFAAGDDPPRTEVVVTPLPVQRIGTIVDDAQLRIAA